MAMTVAWYSIWCFLVIRGAHAVGQRGSASILTEELLSAYGPTSAHPVSNTSSDVTVSITVLIGQIIDMDEADQTLKSSVMISMFWTDPLLTWNSSQYPDVTEVTIPTSKIWRPTLHLYQNLDDSFSYRKAMDEIDVQVYAEGTVIWTTPAILLTSCRMDARKFPFDTQRCHIRFIPWGKPVSKVNMIPYDEPITTSDVFIENGIWQIDDVTFVRELKNYESAGIFSEIEFTVHLKRRSLFYVLNILLPCALLSCLNLLAFFLPTESGEKVSLGITNFLTLILFQQLISGLLPPTSDNTPIILYYFFPMIFIALLSVFSGVVVAALYHQDKSRPIPLWLRKLIALISLRLISVNTQSTPRSTFEAHNSTTINTKLNSSDEYPGMNHHTDIRIAECNDDGQKKGDDSQVGNCDFSAQWQKCALSIDRLFGKIACAVAFISVSVTIVLLAATPN